MEKTEKITKTQTTDVTVDILCNKCGESCLKKAPGWADGGYEGLINCWVEGGVYSTRLGWDVAYRFDICEDCLMDWFETFKLDPIEKY